MAEQHVTIARVHQTPTQSVALRGKQVEAQQPSVGCIVTASDNGFSPTHGGKCSYVVIRGQRVKKTGTVAQLVALPIIALNSETVTYDASTHRVLQLNLYCSEDWVRWDEDASGHSTQWYTFDEYTETAEGYHR